jgi:hypothetical protein
VEKIRTVIYLPVEIKKQIKMEAVRQNTNMSELIEKIVREYLAKGENEK